MRKGNHIFIKVLAGILLLVLVFIISCNSTDVQAQARISFSPSDRFSIPDFNGTFTFAVNGSYSLATLKNDTWAFSNLQLNGSQVVQNFGFSTQNSNVTIQYYRIINGTSPRVTLRYTVEGKGKQIMNFGLGTQANQGAEWSVTTNSNGKSVFYTQDKEWSISSDGTIIVKGLTGNVSVTHYSFLSPLGNNSKLPFYEQHSVAIAAAIAVTITVMVATVIKLKSTLNSNKLSKNT